MPLMAWNDKFSVGVDVIDQDHKKLVSMVNELYDAIQAGKGKEKVGPVLDGLIDYTKMHFAREEKFFAQTAYPDTAAHKKEHETLTKQVLDVQSKYKGGATSTLSLEVMNFLKNWLINHIQGSDKKYIPHLNQKGIK
ncbi:MAG: bacteriohemerythrin [Planctomycetes bacterium]|nr:bacteriohemerythrin [Planctomycetota bacterium]MCC7395951.1 bacteriohemerythrin [Planctomycetota bacterium]